MKIVRSFRCSAGIYAVFIQEHVTNAIGLRRSYQLGLGIFAISMAATVLLSTRYPSMYCYI
jgi:hypothetical protein